MHLDEDEVFYLLEGEMDAYVGDAVLHVKPGDCLFLPFGQPHAWIIRTPVLCTLIIGQPARMDRIFREIKEIADRVPSSSQSYEDAMTGEAIQEILAVAARHRLRVLTPAEIQDELPLFAAARAETL